MKRKGISLIVLIITIIVIVILAVAIILSIAKNKSVVNANDAVNKSDLKTAQEAVLMWISDRWVQDTNGNGIEGEEAGSYYTGTITKEPSEVIITEDGKTSKVNLTVADLGLDSLDKVVIENNVVKEIEKGGTAVSNGTNTPETPVVAVGTIVEDSNATVTGEEFAYNNPVIPVGFKAKETTDASWVDANNDGIVDGWNNGLVIADEDENEFVWVPCTLDKDDITKIHYTKRLDEYPKSSDIKSVSDDEDALPKVNGTTINENDQISTYGGFYIGRYEAGVPENQTSPSNTTGIPVTKKDAIAWTNISYLNARTNALSFCNTDNVKSGLVTGAQWDTVMKWIESLNISVIDCRTWGNYCDSLAPANVEGFGSRQTTGFSEYWKAKNIHDLAGNMWEWTGETSSSYRISRSGRCPDNGNDSSASYRYHGSSSKVYDYMSFRIALYIM